MKASRLFLPLQVCICSALVLACIQAKYTELAHTLLGRDVDVLDGCPLAGKDGDPSDVLKNRHRIPASGDMVSDITFEQLASAPISAKIDQNKAASIEGYLVSAQKTGPEQCNCDTKNPDDWDFHCYIGPTAKAKKSECIIVEVSPRMRFWSLKQLKCSQGKRVRVTGWVFLDAEHKANSAADHGKGRIWRKSCYEIHPVTNIELVN